MPTRNTHEMRAISYILCKNQIVSLPFVETLIFQSTICLHPIIHTVQPATLPSLVGRDHQRLISMIHVTYIQR